MNEFQYLIEYFKQSPLLIQIVWILSILLFIIILLLVVYLKFLRTRLRKNEKITRIYQKKYESLLITFLYTENEKEDLNKEQLAIINPLKTAVKNEFKRNIIVSVLLQLRNEISGEMADSIQKFYYQTGLINYAIAKLKNKKWHIIAKGIRELTQFQVKKIQNKIIPLTSHSNREVRKEAQLYLIDIFGFKGLNFLNNLKTPLSEWDQIQLLEILQRFENQQIPNITPWLKSSNNSVVIFTLKLVKIYSKFEVKETLISLLSHKNKEVRIQLIDVLSYLQITEAKDILKNNFAKSSIEEQIAFLKMLENTFDNSDESFLAEQAIHKNFEIKLASLKILKILNNKLKPLSSETEHTKIVKFLENN